MAPKNPFLRAETHVLPIFKEPLKNKNVNGEQTQTALMCIVCRLKCHGQGHNFLTVNVINKRNNELQLYISGIYEFLLCHGLCISLR